MEIKIKKPRLTSYQKEFLYNDSRYTVTEASTKVGKAQLLDSKVYTPNGYKLMKDVCVGDIVLQPNGKKTKVVDTYTADNLNFYKVNFNDGTFTYCCEDHFWSYTKRNETKVITTNLKEILKISKKELRHVKLLPHGISEFETQDIKIHPYLLGILISDGCITTSGIKFSTNDIEIVSKLKNILPKNHRIKKLKNYDYSIAIKHNATKESYSGDTIANYLRELNLLGLKSNEKFIPDRYKYNSKEVRYEIIRGILDGDGYLDSHNQPRIEQTSKRLAEDIQEVIESLGGIVKSTFKEKNYARHKDGKRVLGKPVYRQGILYGNGSELFFLKRKKNKCTNKKKPINRNFKNIEYVGKKTGKCISVESEDGLYLTDNFIVTHNTFSHIWWIFERAHEPWNKEGYNHWWVAPVYSQTKIAFKRLRVKLGSTGIYKINESNLTITCPNGAVIHFKSADKPDNLFGEDVYSIVFDEAPRAKVEAFYALRSTITATKGKMKLIGNFGGISNWMHQLKEKSKNDKEYAYFKITAWDAVNEGILDELEILQAQRDLPAKVFKQLYLAEEQESDDMLCTYEAINDLWTNKAGKNKNRYITSDIAHLGSDKFVIYVWEGFDILDYFETAKIEPSEVERKIKEYADKYRVGRSNIAYDADGLGGYLKSYLRGAYAFNNGGKVIKQKGVTPNYKNLKSQCGYEFAKRINNREVSISTDKIDKSELIKELECLQSYALDKDGKIQLLPKEKIKEMIGHSPDKLDAMVMREVFELKTKSLMTIRV